MAEIVRLAGDILSKEVKNKSVPFMFREVIWKRRAVGEIIPYSDARELSGI